MWLRIGKQTWLPFSILVLTLMSAGCSHTTPYISGCDQTLSPIEEGGYEDQVRQRVLLVGDAGEPKMDYSVDGSECVSAEPVLEVMERWAKKPVGGKKPFSVFLGDNIYPDGLPPEAAQPFNAEWQEAKQKWEAQYQVLRGSESKGVFIPGNHDWGGAFGKDHKAWEHQQEFLEGKKQSDHPFLVVAKLDSGCPSPVSIDEKELAGVRIIVLNTQWWLTSDDMKDVASCSRTDATSIAKAEREAMEQLSEMLKAAGDDEVIVATHHPMATHGVHGAWYRYFTQDLRGPRNRSMVKAIQAAYRQSGARPLIHAAGHDHSLQVLRGVGETDSGGLSAQYNLVSGAGSKAKLQSVSDGSDTLFAHEHTGFMVVDFMQNGTVFLQVIEPEPQDDSADLCYEYGKRVYRIQLK